MFATPSSPTTLVENGPKAGEGDYVFDSNLGWTLGYGRVLVFARGRLLREEARGPQDFIFIDIICFKYLSVSSI